MLYDAIIFVDIARNECVFMTHWETWRCFNCYFSPIFPKLSMNEGFIPFPGLKKYSSSEHFSNYADITLSLTAINEQLGVLEIFERI